ncbi:hypothetical protein EC991775_1134, partial [Escherichia coli 99.1775]
VKSGKVQVIAPAGFMDEAISEKIVYDRKNLHIMIRVVTLPRCLTRRCAGFFVPRIL